MRDRVRIVSVGLTVSWYLSFSSFIPVICFQTMCLSCWFAVLAEQKDLLGLRFFFSLFVFLLFNMEVSQVFELQGTSYFIMYRISLVSA